MNPSRASLVTLLGRPAPPLERVEWRGLVSFPGSIDLLSDEPAPKGPIQRENSFNGREFQYAIFVKRFVVEATWELDEIYKCRFQYRGDGTGEFEVGLNSANSIKPPIFIDAGTGIRICLEVKQGQHDQLRRLKPAGADRLLHRVEVRVYGFELGGEWLAWVKRNPQPDLFVRG